MSRALVLVGHGSQLSGAPSAAVDAVVGKIRRLGTFDEVRAAFWNEEPQLSRAFDGLPAKDITVVPLGMAASAFADAVPREMGLDGRVTLDYGRVIRLAEPVGSHGGFGEVIVDLARGAGAGGEGLVALLSPGLHESTESAQAVDELVGYVGALGGFGRVASLLLKDGADADAHLGGTTGTVFIVPMFGAEGGAAGAKLAHAVEGRRVVFTDPVLTHPAIPGMVLDLASEAERW